MKKHRMCRIMTALAVAALAAPAQLAGALEVTSPRGAVTTTQSPAVNVLGKADKDATVTVNGVPASVFSSGIFVLDQVPLSMGENKLEVVESKAGAADAVTTLTITREIPPPPPETTASRSLLFVPGSLEPSTALILQPGEVVALAATATSGHTVSARVAGRSLPLDEQRHPATGLPTGVYRANFVVPTVADDVEATSVVFRIEAAGTVEGARELEESAAGSLTIWAPDRVRLMRVTSDYASVAYGVHEVRLGGPYMGEFTSGTIVRATGGRGNHLRVRLSDSLDGWISARDLEPAPAGTPVPYLSFTSVSVTGRDGTDTITIPYSSPVPFTVVGEQPTGGPPSIVAEFFGGHHAATWISHMDSARLVREVRVEQTQRDRVRVRAELSIPRIWGYRTEVTTSSVRILVRRPPLIDKLAASPLEGLLVALEAGHGGPGNVGARGPTGIPEKDINRWTVEALKAELEAAGARTVLVREGDESIGLGDRTRRAMAANADIFISMHANAAGTDRGYLRVSGTSSYYKHQASRDLSAAIQRHLLAETGLADFGNVGSFNYGPIVMNTWMPSMLVEQAFMTHPGDEAKMLDPEFRAKTARATRLGIEEFLREQ